MWDNFQADRKIAVSPGPTAGGGLKPNASAVTFCPVLVSPGPTAGGGLKPM